MSDFVGDIEKMFDFIELSREEFLASYSYLSKEEYDLTKLRMLELAYEYSVK